MLMFKKILVANRGEIAVRIIRTCREMGIQTVAVFSQADRDALHVSLADEAICIGPPEAINSYLKPHNILSAAHLCQADAIHPGYGFLSENHQFAASCEREGITFIGPTSENMKTLGNKISARNAASEANVPLFPGYNEPLEDAQRAKALASEIGYPVIIKSSCGGGGRGMKVVEKESDIERSLHLARTEAKAAFGNADVYIEKFCCNAMHIEVQILCDGYGNAIHLGERKCSLQRRNQKILEEAPAVTLDDALRQAICQAALRLVRHVDFLNAGTVEFLVSESGDFYFMEVNTRIQVEHPVTEMITGVDIVAEQIRIASGEKLRFQQSDIKIQGHAIECRINAEDEKTFAPSPGVVTRYHSPGGLGIRVDSCLRTGDIVSPFYDSLLGKVISFADDRAQAVAKMRRALLEMDVTGIRTNIGLHKRILDDAEFLSACYNTRELEKMIDRFYNEPGGLR